MKQVLPKNPIKYTSVFAAILLTVWTLAIGGSAQTLKADYRFQGNLTSSVAGAAAMTNLTGSNGANSFLPRRSTAIRASRCGFHSTAVSLSTPPG